MGSDYVIKNFEDIDPSGADGIDGRFSRKFLDSTELGMSRWRYEPGTQTPGHRHRVQEAVYAVINGSGRVKLDDEIIEIKQWDVIRVPRWRVASKRALTASRSSPPAAASPKAGTGSWSRATGPPISPSTCPQHLL